MRASGTPLNNALYNFFDRRNNLEEQLINLDRRESQMVMNGANYDEVHAQMLKESEELNRKMNEYILSFIKDNYNNVLGPSVFMMMCSSMKAGNMCGLLIHRKPIILSERFRYRNN